MSIDIDYFNVKSFKLMPVEIRTLASGLDYSVRKIKIQIEDTEHDITLFGSEIDSLDTEKPETFNQGVKQCANG